MISRNKKPFYHSSVKTPSCLTSCTSNSKLFRAKSTSRFIVQIQNAGSGRREINVMPTARNVGRTTSISPGISIDVQIERPCSRSFNTFLFYSIFCSHCRNRNATQNCTHHHDTDKPFKERCFFHSCNTSNSFSIAILVSTFYMQKAIVYSWAICHSIAYKIYSILNVIAI